MPHSEFKVCLLTHLEVNNKDVKQTESIDTIRKEYTLRESIDTIRKDILLYQTFYHATMH